MLILALDTSTRVGSTAVLRDGEVVAEACGGEASPYSTRLFRDVASLQSVAHFELEQVDVFAVAVGPGSFTGLRVGLTAVKAWAEVRAKPIAGISVLEAIAAEFVQGGNSRSTPGGFIAPFLDARRGQVFGGIYRMEPGADRRLALCGDEAVLSLDEFLPIVKASFAPPPVLVSPTPGALPAAKVTAMLGDARIEEVRPFLAATVGRLGFERAKRGDLIDSIRLDANYVRRSDAEAWKDAGVK